MRVVGHGTMLSYRVARGMKRPWASSMHTSRTSFSFTAGSTDTLRTLLP